MNYTRVQTEQDIFSIVDETGKIVFTVRTRYEFLPDEIDPYVFYDVYNSNGSYLSTYNYMNAPGFIQAYGRNGSNANTYSFDQLKNTVYNSYDARAIKKFEAVVKVMNDTGLPYHLALGLTPEPTENDNIFITPPVIDKPIYSDPIEPPIIDDPINNPIAPPIANEPLIYVRPADEEEMFPQNYDESITDGAPIAPININPVYPPVINEPLIYVKPIDEEEMFPQFFDDERLIDEGAPIAPININPVYPETKPAVVTPAQKNIIAGLDNKYLIIGAVALLLLMRD